MSAKDAGARLPRGIARFRGRYRVRKDHQGTTHSLGVFQTITDARAALHIAKADAARGTFVPPAQRRVERQAEALRVQTEALTLGEWARTAGQDKRVVVAHHDHLLAVGKIDADDRVTDGDRFPEAGQPGVPVPPHARHHYG